MTVAALLLLAGCAPALEAPCAALQGALEDCGTAGAAYECEGAGAASNALLACMADYVAASPECDARGTLDYVDLTTPAYEACG